MHKLGWLARRSAVRARAGWPWRDILGRVETPRSGDVFKLWVDVHGWALARDGTSVRVLVSGRGRVLAEAAPALPRPDVARYFPEIASSGACGFAARVPGTLLPETGRVVLRFDALREDASGRVERRRLGRVRISRGDYAPQVHARADYRGAWDAAASSANFARIAVCGTADQHEWERSGRETAADIASASEVRPTDIVLEIGCGNGRVGTWMAPRCGRWIGADVSPRMLEHARQALSHLPNVSLQLVNGHDLHALEDASIDVVYCTAVFMHLDEWERYRFITEAYRVLRPGGRIYFDTFNLIGAQGWTLFLQMADIDPPLRPPNISRSSTPEELRAYAERAGFADIKVRAGSLWVTVTARKGTSAA